MTTIFVIINIDLRHQYGISARVADVPPRETFPAAKSELKRMFSHAKYSTVYLHCALGGVYMRKLAPA